MAEQAKPADEIAKLVVGGIETAELAFDVIGIGVAIFAHLN